MLLLVGFGVRFVVVIVFLLGRLRVSVTGTPLAPFGLRQGVFSFGVFFLVGAHGARPFRYRLPIVIIIPIVI